MRKFKGFPFQVWLIAALCFWSVSASAQQSADAKLPRGKDPRALFTAQEQQVILPGLGNPVAQLLVARELDKRWPLPPRARVDLQNLSREVTPKLIDLRAQRARQERALEDAIYGAHFDAAAIENLANESAATQAELARLQGFTELRLVQIYGRGNPRRARMARAFVETLIRPQPQRLLPQLLLTRPNAGPMRFLVEFFGDDWDLMIPGFGNPASFLLILQQLELTPEQKAELKTLSQSVRADLQKEAQERNQQQNNLASGNREPADTEEPDAQPSRQEIVGQIIAANATRQAQQLKRQARIETRIRQVLQPKQWDTYVTLLRGLAGINGNWAMPNAAPKKLLRQTDTARPQPPDVE